MQPDERRPKALADALAGRLAQSITLPAGRPSAVLCLFYPTPEGLRVALTRRSDGLGRHSGQISFPGGACDPQDQDYWQTALREAREEVGLTRSPRHLGFLPPIFIPASGFAVAPCVGYLTERPEYVIDPQEVVEVIEPPLQELWPLEDWEVHHRPEGEYVMPCYVWRGIRIWGATARMLRALRLALEEADL